MLNTDWVQIEMTDNEDEIFEMTWSQFLRAGYPVDMKVVEEILNPNGVFFGDKHGAPHIFAVSRLFDMWYLAAKE